MQGNFARLKVGWTFRPESLLEMQAGKSMGYNVPNVATPTGTSLKGCSQLRDSWHSRGFPAVCNSLISLIAFSGQVLRSKRHSICRTLSAQAFARQRLLDQADTPAHSLPRSRCCRYQDDLYRMLGQGRKRQLSADAPRRDWPPSPYRWPILAPLRAIPFTSARDFVRVQLACMIASRTRRASAVPFAPPFLKSCSAW
jgi:hypothetical protein